MKSHVPPLVLLVASLLAVSGCSGSSHSSTTHTTPARTATSTLTTPPPTPSTRTSPASAGGPVPPGNKATSVTFISPALAFVLGTAPCQHAPCSVILRTRDRGGSWQGLPAPREAVSEFLGNGLWGLRFADARHGYAYGNGFWQTANGGASWQPGGGPARIVLALEAVQDRELVAIAARCLPGQSRCPDTLGLYRRPISSQAWTLVAAKHTIPFEASIAVHGAVVWALAGNRLYVSDDGGASFNLRPQPCWPSHPRNGMPSLVTDDGAHIYLLCTGSGGAGSVDKFVFRVGRSESQWTRVGSPPRGGGPEGLSAGSDRAVVIAAASGASELYRSTDAGRSWQTVLTENDGGAGWADLGFTTPSYGVVVHGPAVSNGANDGRPGQLLLTDDGGRTWQRVSF
jgi:hypothetical protein